MRQLPLYPASPSLILNPQIRIAHQAFIHLPGGFPSFPDGPDYKGLAAVHIAGSEHVLYICAVPALGGFYVRTPIQRDTEGIGNVFFRP